MVYIAAADVLANFAVGSLKQLKSLASQNEQLVVAAQFYGDGRRNVPRLVFGSKGNESGSLQDNKKDEIPYDTDMADPCALTDFIDWAYRECRADHYSLFLWGHGPELLVEDYPAPPSGKQAKKFLTPADLRKALADTDLVRDGRKLEVLGVDCCNMSMMELACDLQDYVEFLVASQEEVPDFSFPYDKLGYFNHSKESSEIKKLVRDIPGCYVDAYRDYIVSKEAKTESLTLAALSLKDTAILSTPLRRLAEALLNNPYSQEKRQAIIDARANSRAFVAGLYVDLYDFCEQVKSCLSAADIRDHHLLSACKEICEAIRARGSHAFVLANQSPQDKHCHGISLYFPYKACTEKSLETGITMREGLDTRTKRKVEAPHKSNMDNSHTASKVPPQRGGLDVLNKGGLDVLNKGGMDVLNKGGMDVLNKLRRQRIQETEQYYPGLEISKITRWDEFIRSRWSRWLAEKAEDTAKSSSEANPEDLLDQQYSAQQCAFNLLSLCRQLEMAGSPQETEMREAARPSSDENGYMMRGS
jgi:hypothetical protein